MSRLDTPVNFEILDHLPQGVIILRHDGTVTFWNQCLEDWTGIFKSTIVGTSIDTHFPHLGTPKYTSRLEPLFTGGPPATFASQFHPQFLSCSLPSGQPRIQQTMAKTIWDEPTQAWQALIIIQDISDLNRQVVESQRLRKQAQAEMAERKESEIALRESETRLDLAVNGTHDGIWDWMDVTQDEEWWSPRFYQLLGYAPGEISPSLTTFNSLLHPADLERTVAAVQNHFEQQRPFDIDYRLRTKSGVYRWFRARGTALRDESGRPTRMAGSIQDITESRELEEERQGLSNRLILATASAGMGIWDWDIINNVLKWDATMFALYGVSPDQFSGAYEAWVHGVHPDDRERAEQELQLALEGKKDFNTEFRVILGNQSIHHIAARCVVERDENGKSVRMIGVNWEITSKKQSELDLLESEGRLQAILDHSSSVIYLKDLQGEYLFINRTFERLFKLHRNYVIGKKDGDIFPPEMTKGFMANDRLALTAGPTFEIEELVPQEDGLHTYLSNKFPLLNGDGSPYAICCMATDITNRKNEELERDQRELLLNLVFETGPGCIKRVNTAGILLHMNPAGLALIEAEKESDALGLCVFNLVTSEHRTAFERMHHDVIKGKIRTLQFEIQGLKGTRRWMETFASPFLNPITNEIEHLAVTHDITERKISEITIKQANSTLEQQNQELAKTRDQALSAARSKSEFLATMSHEIRTPLNGVIGMTDLLLDTGLNADQHEMMETVKHSGEFLLTLINDILDFSKNDAGKLDLEIIDFDIRTAIDEVLDILAERAIQKNLELIGLIYATTPLQVRGDPGRIKQILFNLIGNAIKFTQEGEIVVDVSILETTTDSTTLRFAVTDTGIGIPPEAQRNLFESFTQADNSTTRKFGGTGLGLAICKQLVTLMHGEIGVISEQEHGSTFWFTIPFAHSSSSPTPLSKATLQGRRVCIVESNDTIRFLLQHYIQSWGMTCEVAQNGHEGFASLQQHAKEEQSFDVALLDHTLSESIQEDGLSLAKRIRQNPEISHIPLILLTAFGKRGEGKLAQHAGFSGYLTKPIRHQQLQQCLQMILGHDQQTPSSTTRHSSTLITRHTVEEAQAHTQVHILLAEDNVVNQKVAVRMLQKLGYRVDVVENGQEAVKAVSRTSYDLVLMDCQMPEMDGLEATCKIREVESVKHKALGVRSEGQESEFSETPDALPLTPHENLRIPIIALTANALSGDRETCLAAGMDDFLTKPVRVEELGAMISKWLPHPGEDNETDHPITEKARKDFATLPPCLDATILENLKKLAGEDDPDFFLTVIDQFLSDLPRYFEGLQQAIDRQDPEALIKTAHACKGSSSSIGALSLMEISYALELVGRERLMEAVPAKFEQWLQVQNRTIHALQQEREQLTAEVQREK